MRYTLKEDFLQVDFNFEDQKGRISVGTNRKLASELSSELINFEPKQ